MDPKRHFTKERNVKKFSHTGNQIHAYTNKGKSF